MDKIEQTGLLEREGELAHLRSLVEQARDGGRVLLLSGAAGTGKSSLLSALRDITGGIGTMRSGRCDPLTTPAPLGPLYEMLPSLPPEVAIPLAEGGRRELVFSELLTELGRRPNVFAVDDAHWADEATTDLLRYLGRRITRTRAILVITFRGEEVARDHPLRALLGEVATHAERIELRPLTLDAVTTLVAGTDLDPLRVYALSGGNPFFVRQMVAYPDDELPPTVEDAVLARTRSLPPTAWEVLDAVALSPEGVPAGVLERLSPTAEQDADAATTLGLLAVEGGRLRSTHELVRLALAAAVPPARRRRLHLRLLDLIGGSTVTAADAATLAHHAMGTGDRDLIVRYCLPAADRAALDGAHREAVSLYGRVLDAEDRLDGPALNEILERYYYECYLIGATAEALRAAQRASQLADDIDTRGRHLRWMSRLSWLTGDRKAAEHHGREAVELLERQGSDEHERAFAYSNLAQLAALNGDAPTTERWGRRALELAERIGDDEVAAHALNNLGLVDPRERELLRRSLSIALEHDYEEHAARAYTNLSHQLLMTSELVEAETVFDDGIAWTGDRDLDTWRTAMLDGRSLVRLLTGDWPGAEADARNVLSLAGDTILSELARLTLARLALMRGSVDADSLIADVERRARDSGETEFAINAAALELERAWHRGDRPDDRVVDRGLEAAVAHGNPWARARLGFWLLRLGRDLPPVELPPPVVAETTGGTAAAASVWEQTGAVVEPALLRGLDRDEDVRRSGLERLRALGADGTLQALRRHLAAAGIREVPRGPNRSTRQHPAGLTPRQVDVLGYLVQGRTNADIASELYISEKTVEHHVSAILDKLGASTRTEAALIARQRGLA